MRVPKWYHASMCKQNQKVGPYSSGTQIWEKPSKILKSQLKRWRYEINQSLSILNVIAKEAVTETFCHSCECIVVMICASSLVTARHNPCSNPSRRDHQVSHPEHSSGTSTPLLCSAYRTENPEPSCPSSQLFLETAPP